MKKLSSLVYIEYQKNLIFTCCLYNLYNMNYVFYYFICSIILQLT